ncbi:uncharacterized protein LOC130647975 [Hydractinia symbiolongicarpus]|uniref:uncharacterized protein LOC130647975 n=1 Tax=Hydractinia symbiolongicarpus TaxID=13093 RepID=UPI00254D1699|nr:uncharacterized protein LOC130647975 [Hydractinia symbiolongicarpus]
MAAVCFGCRWYLPYLFMYCITTNLSIATKDLEIIVEEKPELCDDFARIGDLVYVDYTGMLRDGRVFDSSMHDGRSPLKFQLGAGTLIKGWERGIQGMCVGEKRKLVIPPHLGYGSQGVDGVIPPDSTLLFQVHLMNLERPSVVNQLQHFLQFAIWPFGLLCLVYYLYRKLSTAIAKDNERKPEKRSGKKRR